jgi:uncharacterized protein YecE (DUF72 family)
MDLASDFVVARFMAPKSYTPAQRQTGSGSMGKRVARWATGKEPDHAERFVSHPAVKKASRDVYLYFDNEAKVRAPFDGRN